MCVLTCLIIIFPSEITAVVNERGCVRCAAVLLVFNCRAITSLEGVNKMMVVALVEIPTTPDQRALTATVKLKTHFRNCFGSLTPTIQIIIKFTRNSEQVFYLFSLLVKLTMLSLIIYLHSRNMTRNI